MKKGLLLTFDYELFLGGDSGSVENCLIRPTNLIIEVLKKYSASSIFFVDTIYLLRLKEVSEEFIEAKNDFEKIISQLRKIIEIGGYVFHHIHPHWLDAKYNGTENKWDLSNNSRFALNCFNSKEIEVIFDKSKFIIDYIYTPFNYEDHQGYRAGGLYAQPFLNYKKFFQKNKIKYDFSVLKGGYSSGDGRNYSFDYRNTPTKSFYKFDDKINHEIEEGEFIEVTLTNFCLSGISKVINGIYYRYIQKKSSFKRIGDGKSSGNIIKPSRKRIKVFYSEETYSIELLNKFKAILYYNKMKRTEFLHLISHPKLMSHLSVESFEFFLKISSKKNEIEYDFKKIIEGK